MKERNNKPPLPFGHLPLAGEKFRNYGFRAGYYIQ